MTTPDFAPWAIERALEPSPLGSRHAVRSAGAPPAALDAAHGRPLALTVLGPALMALVRDPARALGALRALAAQAPALPPALLPVLDAGRAADGALWIVTPLDDAPSAAARLARGRALPGALVARAGIVLADALDAAHEAGIRHGAIVPALVQLDQTGARPGAHLLAPGLAPALAEGGAPLPAIVAALGGPAYAAPELAAGDAGPRGDVFALGATLYALLTSKPPFGGRVTSFAMAAVLADEPGTGEVQTMPKGDEAVARAQETERLTTALLRAVEKAPDDRWPDMHAFALALSGRAPTPPAVAATSAEPEVTATGRGCGATAAVMVLLAAVAALS